MHSDTEGRADEAEQLKQEQLKNQKEGKGKWEEGLASDSESIVRVSLDLSGLVRANDFVG